MIAGVRISDVFVAVETVAQDERTGKLIGFTHRGETEHIKGVPEYIELTAQIAESYGVDPDVMCAAIALREEQETYEQA